ncbi:MAG TPA: carbohydrate porin [Myxococcales bacterium]|jgi:high affinity Mn2+ porin
MRPLALGMTAAFLCLPMAARAEGDAPWALQGSWWAVGGQTNGILQANTISGGPRDPALSFAFEPALGWSTVVTLQGAVRLWKGAMLVVMPGWADGAGMPNASGAAGYPDGDLQRVGKVGLAPYVARAFLHQDIALGERSAGEKKEKEKEKEEEEEEATFEERFAPSGPHRFAAGASDSRLELTLGKLSTTDFFDASAIASDPKHHFMNWALIAQGAFDFPADTRGYTYGVVAALSLPHFAARAGLALLPREANGPDLEWNVLKARSLMVELEGRWTLRGRSGSLKLLGWANWARMGSFREAIDAAGAGGLPDVTATRREGRLKYGGGVLVEQELASAARAFLRAGANDGHSETFCFTEIDRDVELGAEVSGTPWGRAADRAGLGLAANGLSAAHAEYLRRGGKGFQLGDGSLRAGWEWIGELYYAFVPVPYLEITADVQGLLNPGMNRQRGPVAVFGLRLHLHV